jgi:uncharacterized membrane protein YkvA (DUF1232 family)
MGKRIKELVARARVGALTLWYALNDERTPWFARALAAIVLAYALSPLDLIPDFIPVVGLLDDALLIPLGVFVVLRLIPDAVRREAQERARDEDARLPKWRAGGVVVVITWLVLGAAMAVGAWRAWGSPE